jgi:uncharacterized protein YbaR (Trm112 family)/ubiquinone/menaquinone biosynthesis C-methylase UbiE
MKYRLIDLLCCPYDGGFPLRLISREATERAPCKASQVVSCDSYCSYQNQLVTGKGRPCWPCGGCRSIDIKEGELICPECDRHYRISAGIPQLLPDELTVTEEEPPADEAGRIKWLQQRQRNREADIFEAQFAPFSTQVDIGTVIPALDPKPGDRVLDAGSGPGRLTRSVVARCRETIALDFSIGCLKILSDNLQEYREQASLHCVLGDVEHSPFRDAVFDKVLSFGILEHLPDQASIKNTLRETHRVLVSQGVAAITAYSHTPIRAFIARFLGIDYSCDGWHGEIFFHRSKLDETRELIREFFPQYDIRGIRNIPKRLGKILRAVAPAIDISISATPLSRLTGYYFLVRAIADRSSESK